MNVSFAPLSLEAVEYLATGIGIDYTQNYPFINEDRWFCATARDDEGAIMGVILAEFVNWFEVYFNTAVGDARCVTRRLLRAVFKTLFSRAVRVTAFVDVNNARAIRNTVRMGFVHEGLCRMGINGNRDAFTFGMLKSDCRFLPKFTPVSTLIKEPYYGQRRTGTA